MRQAHAADGGKSVFFTKQFNFRKRKPGFAADGRFISLTV